MQECHHSAMPDKETNMTTSRRDFLRIAAVGAVAAAGPRLALSQAETTGGAAGGATRDRVLICNEDSNTLSVINPNTNTIETTINLTSFDEDPRPPFR